MKRTWNITVTASSHMPNGQRVSMRRNVEGAGDAAGAMLTALLARNDAGRPFLGCEIRGITPLGQRIVRTFDPDTRTLV